MAFEQENHFNTWPTLPPFHYEVVPNGEQIFNLREREEKEGSSLK